MYSGGGYFRLLPHSAIKFGFDHSDYVMTYFHPRDFDPDQPIIPGLSRARRFRSYVGLKTALSKLERLAENSDFISLDSAIRKVNWNQVKKIPFSEISGAVT